MLRPPASAARTQRGFTLVEFLVVLVLIGVIGGIVTSSLIRGLQTADRADDRISATLDLQRAIERVGRELRAADPLIFPTSGATFRQEVRAQVKRDGQTFRYRYYLVDTTGGAELREDVRRVVDGEVVESRDGLFIADVANLQTDTELFTYYVVDPITGEFGEAQCDDPTDAACRDLHLTATQIRMRLERLLPNQDPIGLETVVNIRNTRYSAADDLEG